MFKKIYLLIITIVFFSCKLYAQTTVYVDSSATGLNNGTSWVNAFKSLTQGLTTANFGTGVYVVNVAKGTYRPTTAAGAATTNMDSSFRIFRSGIKVYGGYPNGGGTRNVAAQPTILSGDIGVANDSTDNVYHVFTILPYNGTNSIDSTTVLDGLTITHGNGLNAPGGFSTNGFGFNHQDGGGLYIGAQGGLSCTPLINNCIFYRNTANFGGAFYANGFIAANDFVGVNFSNCVFSSNVSGNTGGAIFNNSYGVGASTIKSNINNCSFIRNYSYVNAGAIYHAYDTAIITNCTFTNDSAENAGGAFFESNAYNTITNSSFTGNVAFDYAGGALYLDGGVVNINASTFSSNVTDSSIGGAIVTSSTFTANNCSFTANRAWGGGGAIRTTGGVASLTFCTFTNNFNQNNYGGGIESYVNTSLASCTFTNNSSGLAGGGFLFGGGTNSANNCKFSNNQSVFGAATSVTFGASMTASTDTFTRNIASGYGGGFYGQDGGTVSFQNALFTFNTSGSYGGGIENNGPTLIITSSTFSDNKASFIGGGAYVHGPSTISNSFFTRDSAQHGAGIYNDQVTNTVKGCTFSSNISTGNGGGIDHSGTALCTIDSCGFTNGKAIYGGGVYNVGTAILTRTAITGNNAATQGGGIYNTGTFTCYNNTILNDTSATGGGIYNGGAATTITKCTVNNNKSSGNGGGLYNISTSLCSIDSATVTGNLANTSGGGFYNAGLASMNHSTVSSNRSISQGGGIYSSDTFALANTTLQNDSSAGAGGMSNNSYATIKKCTFTGNVSALGSGGGLGNFGGAVCTIDSNTITLNKALNFGGGFYNAGVATLNHSLIQGNTITSGGGGICNTDTLTVSNSFITANTAINAAGTVGSGGGFQNNSGYGIINNSVIANNIAGGTGDDGGGALTVYGNTMSLNNVTLSGNTTASTVKPGANSISIISGTVLNLTNSLAWGTAAAQVTNLGTINYSYSDVKGITPTATNLNTDPLFVNPGNAIGSDNTWGTTDDGLRLNPCSPVINAGSNALIPSGITTDVTVAARIQNTTVEMGAYEMPYPYSGLPITTISSNTANPVCPATSIIFTALTVSGGASPTYQWYKNGVPVGLNQNTYTASGWLNNDSVWVINTNNTCNLTDTSNHYIVTVPAGLPTPGSIAGNAAPCANSTQTYSVANVAGATSYAWAVPSGWTINGATNTNSISVTTGTASGAITVGAVATCGASAPSSLPVAVVTTPPAPGTIAGSAVVCAGSSNNYSITAITSATTYTWTVPSGWTITGGQGTISLTVTASNAASSTGNIGVTSGNSCFTSSQNTLSVSSGFQMPGVSVAANPSGAICAGTPVTFTATPINGGGTPTYLWRKNGITVTGIGNTYTDALLNNNDVITVKMHSTSACAQPDSAVSTPLTVAVNSVSAIASATPTNTTTCGGSNGSVVLGGLAANTAYTVAFSRNSVVQMPQSLTSNASGALTIAGLNAGSYNNFTVASVTCTSANFGGPAVVNDPASPAAPVVSSNSPVCLNGTLNLNVVTISGATYSWTGPSFTSTSQNPSITSVTAAAAGSYTVTATVAGCASTPASTNVVINTIPVAPATLTGNAGICANSANTYTASTVGNATSYTWILPSGWSGSSTSNAITATANGNGGTLKVAAANTCGSSPNDTLVVAVTPVSTPSVSIVASVTANTTCSGTSVTFTPTPVNGGATPTYQWLKNGANVATGATYTTTTLINGDIVKAIMTTSLPCYTTPTATSNADTMTIISIPAQPGTITGNTGVCNGSLQTYFIAAVPAATFYTWTLPNTTWAGTSTTTSIATTPGSLSGIISITAGNVCGSSAASGLAVTVINIPNAPSPISGNVAPCAGSTVGFAATAQGNATSYNWILPAGWIGASNTSTISVTSGTTNGNILVTATNVCGTSLPATLAVTAQVVPPAPTVITGNATPCVGSSQLYSINTLLSPTATSFSWTYPSGNGWSTSTPQVGGTLFTIPGSSAGLITVAGNNVCGQGPGATLAISPIVVLTPAVTLTSNTTTACAGSPVTFIATATNGGTNPTYTWRDNGLAIASAPNSFTYAPTNLQNLDAVSVVVTSSYACLTYPAITSSPILMNILPTVTSGINVNILPGTAPCIGAPISFVTNITGGGTFPQYQWYKNGAAIFGANNATLVSSAFVTGDTVTALLTSNATCLTNPAQISNKLGLTLYPITTPTVAVGAVPVGNVAPGTPVTFTAYFLGGGPTPSFVWMKNGLIISTATGTTYTTTDYVDGDQISVQMTSTAPCVTQSQITAAVYTLHVVATGIASVGNWNGSLTIYPNPNQGHFTINATWNESEVGKQVKIELLNTLGQIVYHNMVIPDRASWSVPIWLDDAVANGLYQLRVGTDNMSGVKPVLITR